MEDLYAESLWAKHKYAAFISYSRADLAAGDKFQRGIERYRIPKPLVARGTLNGPVPKRLVPIFRDVTDMVAAGDLGAQIEKTLQESAFLILICSPHSAKSMWVNTEVETFKRKGAKTRIIPVLLDGDPVEYHPEHAPNGAFPPALLRVIGADGQLTDEREPAPIAPDLRPTAEGYNFAVLKTVATMIGLAPDILSQRQSEMERRDRRIARMITSVVTVLAIAATVAAFSAWQQMISARQSQSLAFAGLAWNTIEEGNYDNGARLALQGLPAGQGNVVNVVSADAEDAMASALWNNRVTARHLAEARQNADPVEHIELSADGSTASVVSSVGSIRVIDMESGALRMEVPYAGKVAESDFDGMFSAALSPDGSQLITFPIRPWGAGQIKIMKKCNYAYDPEDERDPIFASAGVIWSVETGCPVRPLGRADFNDPETGDGWFMLGGYYWSPDARTVLVTGWSNDASRVIDVESGEILFAFDAGGSSDFYMEQPAPFFAPDGKSIIAKTGRLDASLLDARTGASIKRFTLPDGEDEFGDKMEIATLQSSADGKTLIVEMREGTIYLIDVATGEAAQRDRAFMVRQVWSDGPDGMPSSQVQVFEYADSTEPLWRQTYDRYAVLRESNLMVGFSGTQGEIRDLTTGDLRLKLSGHVATVSAIKPVSDGVLLTGDDAGEIRRWTIVPRAPESVAEGLGRVLRGPDGRVFALSDDGLRVLVLGDDLTPAQFLTLEAGARDIRLAGDRLVAEVEGGIVSARLADALDVRVLSGIRSPGGVAAGGNGDVMSYVDTDRQLALAGGGLDAVRIAPQQGEYWGNTAIAPEQGILIASSSSFLVGFEIATQAEVWRFEGFPEALAAAEAEAAAMGDLQLAQPPLLLAQGILPSPDGSRFLMTFDESPRAEYRVSHALLMDTETGAIVSRLPFGVYEDMREARFSEDGTLFVTHSWAETGTTPDFRVWRVSDGALVSSFSLPPNDVNPDGPYGSDYTISPSGQRIATLDGGRILVWGARTGRLIADLTSDLSAGAPRFDRIEFSADALLAHTEDGGLVKLAVPDELSGAQLAARACNEMSAARTDIFAPEELARVSIPQNRLRPCNMGGLLSPRFYKDLLDRLL